LVAGFFFVKLISLDVVGRETCVFNNDPHALMMFRLEPIKQYEGFGIPEHLDIDSDTCKRSV
jgi:hypothetical protein